MADAALALAAARLGGEEEVVELLMEALTSMESLAEKHPLGPGSCMILLKIWSPWLIEFVLMFW